MEQLARDYADVADFFTVWVREAHAGGDFPQPENVEQRAHPTRPTSRSCWTTWMAPCRR